MGVFRQHTWTGRWVLLQGHRPGTPCGLDTPQLQDGRKNQEGHTERDKTAPPWSDKATQPFLPRTSPHASRGWGAAQYPCLTPRSPARAVHGERRAVLTAGPLSMVPPVNAGTFLGTEGCIGLYTGTLQIRVRHKAAIKQAGFIVVLGRHEGVALREQAMQGEIDHTLVSTPASPHASLASPCPAGACSEAPAKEALCYQSQKTESAGT